MTAYHSGNLPFIDKDRLRILINASGKDHSPFYFITDFLQEKNLFIPEADLGQYPIKFAFNGDPGSVPQSSIPIQKHPVSFVNYIAAFKKVEKELHLGNTFLVNLTQPSVIETDRSLSDIFDQTTAPFKLLVDGYFVVFSPESFIRIKDGIISSYPMKGTISAHVPFAEDKIIASKKEAAEHATIVDLIRNDLSIHAHNVTVKRFKYLERVNTGNGDIIQMSSEIQGELPENYSEQLGDILLSLLPAGSISGAPKEKTIEIIKKSEDYDRGFYTGVAGHYNGSELKSFVMIRFIEQSDKLIYKSGGGITSMSQAEAEYQELIEKIYVPVF